MTCLSVALLIVLASFWASFWAPFAQDAEARAMKTRKEVAQKALVIKDFKWRSGGMGRHGILKEITIENIGKRSYKNIEIEAEFFTYTDMTQGSLRSTIKEIIEPGAIKTFHDLKFGIMHSALQKTVLRVTTAKTVSTGVGAYINPSELVFVKEWEWTGGRYGTEGVFKQVVLENRSEKDLKNLELLVEYIGGKIRRSYARVLIQDILPAKSTKKFMNVNVGFRHPEANKEIVSVIKAEISREKKVYKKRVIKRRVASVKPGQPAGQSPAGQAPAGKSFEQIDERDMSPTQRRKAKILHKRAEAETVVVEREHFGSTLAEEMKPPEAVASIKKDSALLEERTAPKFVPAESAEEPASIEYIEIEEEVIEENPIPDQDILVTDFKVRHTVPYTVGYFDTLVLENKSTITYRRIKLLVNFYSRTDNRPLGSAVVFVNDLLDPKAVKKLRNVKIGFLNLEPEVVVVRVKDAIVVR